MMDLSPSYRNLMNLQPSKIFAIYNSIIKQECHFSPFPFLLIVNNVQMQALLGCW
jgi:hypothetical protein